MNELAQIRAALAEIQRSQGRTEGTLAALTASIERRNEHDRRSREDTEHRLRALEGGEHRRAGKSSVLGAIGGVVAAVLVGLINNHR